MCRILHGLPEDTTLLEFLYDDMLMYIDVEKAARWLWWLGVVLESHGQVTWLEPCADCDRMPLPPGKFCDGCGKKIEPNWPQSAIIELMRTTSEEVSINTRNVCGPLLFTCRPPCSHVCGTHVCVARAFYTCVFYTCVFYTCVFYTHVWVPLFVAMFSYTLAHR